MSVETVDQWDSSAFEWALNVVGDERIRQVNIGWTPTHDDQHGVAHFHPLIQQRLDEDYKHAGGHVTASEFDEKRLVQIGALALAALETLYRCKAHVQVP